MQGLQNQINESIEMNGNQNQTNPIPDLAVFLCHVCEAHPHKIHPQTFAQLDMYRYIT